MIRAYSILTTKQQAVTIYFDQERGELCRNPHMEDDVVKWERLRASNVLAAFAVEQRYGDIRGEYRNDTLKALNLTEQEIEQSLQNDQQTNQGGP